MNPKEEAGRGTRKRRILAVVGFVARLAILVGIGFLIWYWGVILPSRIFFHATPRP